MDMSAHTGHGDHAVPTPIHGGHGDHGGHGATGSTCSNGMVFTWDYTNMCVVFNWWQIKSTFDLIWSLILIVAIAAGYEFLRYRMRVLEGTVTLGNRRDDKPMQAVGYALQVGYSFLLMLIFMTYNGWAMIAVCVGAAIGFYLWGDRASNREMNCH